MKYKLLFFALVILVLYFLTRSEEVKEDEIGIVFSYWNGHIYDEFYNPGTYRISIWRGFQCPRILEKSDSIKLEDQQNEIKVSFKPIPERNFEVIRIYGLDYASKIVHPILLSQRSILNDFKGNHEQLIQELREVLQTNDTIKKYLRITKLELKGGE